MTAATAAAMGPNMVVRSSMEMMLEALLRKDEQQQVRDVPPALPVRPTSKARLPARRIPLPLGPKPAIINGDAEKENRKPVEHNPSSGLKKPVDQADLNYNVMDEEKLTSSEDARSRPLQGIMWFQKQFRCRRDCTAYQELKQGAVALQSFIRGEKLRSEFNLSLKRWKAATVIQKNVRSWNARKIFGTYQWNVALLQSAIRGMLAKRQLDKLRNMERTKLTYAKSHEHAGKKLQEMKEIIKQEPEMHNSVVAELHMRVLKAEAALRKKEEENLTLRQQLQQYDMKWSENEAKMKSMEEMWQKQMASLQVSLAAAKRSLAANTITPPTKPDASPNGRYCKSEDYNSVDYHTPDGTPAKQPYVISSEGIRKSEPLSAVSLMVREFEHCKAVFEDDAGYLVEAKSRQSGYGINPDEELKNLKACFAAWKKEFKAKLKETKSALRKLGKAEQKKTRRSWWGWKISGKA